MREALCQINLLAVDAVTPLGDVIFKTILQYGWCVGPLTSCLLYGGLEVHLKDDAPALDTTTWCCFLLRVQNYNF